MSLPYSTASSGTKALADIQKVLRHFGCNKFGSMVDDEHGELMIQFEHQGRMVSVKCSYRGYAAAWLKENPWSYRRQSTKQEWERKAMDIGSVAIYSVARDWIKGQVTAIETGILTFEGAFLGQILLPNGMTVLEHVSSKNLLAAPADSDGDRHGQ